DRPAVSQPPLRRSTRLYNVKALHRVIQRDGRHFGENRMLSLSRAAAILSLLTLCLGAGAAQAADPYPTRPVRLVVGYAAGGPTDIVARVMAQWLTDRLGQQFIVENKPGAGGNVATEAVINS